MTESLCPHWLDRSVIKTKKKHAGCLSMNTDSSSVYGSVSETRVYIPVPEHLGRTRTTHSKHTHACIRFSLKYTHWPETHPNQALSLCLPNRLTLFFQAVRGGWGSCLPPLKTKCGINQTRPFPLPLWPGDRRLIWASSEGVDGKVSQLIHQTVRKEAGIGDRINGRQTERT